MLSSTPLLVAALAGAAFGKLHTICGCQKWSDGPMHNDATITLGNSGCTPWVFAPVNFQGVSQNSVFQATGPVRFEGVYLQDIGGGKVMDGHTVYKYCKRAGAGDSACFECGSIQQNANGKFQCN
ncbi:uncharacterized protein UV8b_01143 [Ustilaginoidea virens]|uniref:Uncharacterized protein n=1 Tax=Ustilaginoidea virens TaxID=1159556 RepID=A0A8E5HKD8_USTVR|nr:uncharacterized protein UV8b_01143 [Ustilaginoidea virens]QUC16902.1 hypothetical protein UV8b_01143 [Ustilaginoidea virens]